MPPRDDYMCATLGSSKAASRLRRAVTAAAADATRRPVLVSGEPGLKKCHVGAMVHYTSIDSNRPLLKVDCEATHDLEAVLFGSGGGRVLGALRQTGGTLLLNNVHVVLEGPLRRRLRGLLTPGAETAGARIICTSEHPQPDLEATATVIKASAQACPAGLARSAPARSPGCPGAWRRIADVR